MTYELLEDESNFDNLVESYVELSSFIIIIQLYEEIV
jgi:hypothetical protein